jgi:uncharacterized membrane protein
MRKKDNKISRNINKKSLKGKNISSLKSSKKIIKDNKSKLDIIDEKLDRILSNQKTLLYEEKKTEKKEDEIEKEEKIVECLEKKELLEEMKLRDTNAKETIELKHFEKNEEKQLNEIKNIEAGIKKDVEPHNLRKLSRKDFFKAITGAFAGLVVHFSFNYVFELSKYITFTRATFLFILSFIIGIVIIYATGFRKVEEKKHLVFLPLRAILIYFTTLIVSIIVLFIFSPSFGLNFKEAYVQTSLAMITAIIGATTADLIGKN